MDDTTEAPRPVTRGRPARTYTHDPKVARIIADTARRHRCSFSRALDILVLKAVSEAA